jgi:hypothetical protein
MKGKTTKNIAQVSFKYEIIVVDEWGIVLSPKT